MSVEQVSVTRGVTIYGGQMNSSHGFKTDETRWKIRRGNDENDELNGFVTIKNELAGASAREHGNARCGWKLFLNNPGSFPLRGGKGTTLG